MKPLVEDADISRRLFAYFLDLIPQALIFGILYAPRNIGNGNIVARDSFPDPLTAIPTILAISFGYFFISQLITKGQSPGQYFMKIRIVSEKKIREFNEKRKSGKIGNINEKYRKSFLEQLAPTPAQSALHALGKTVFLIPIDLILGVILYRHEGDAQKPCRFLQKLAETRVISLK